MSPLSGSVPRAHSGPFDGKARITRVPSTLRTAPPDGKAFGRLSPPASGIKPAQLLLALPSPAHSLAASGRLHEQLARLLDERELQLPKLVDRSEDLRALVLEGLSRFGVGTSGEPLGIEPAALALLTEHDFPGNELELFGLLARTAASARGTRISADDLLKSGLSAEAGATSADYGAGGVDDPSLGPPPSLAVRRRSLRRAR